MKEKVANAIAQMLLLIMEEREREHQKRLRQMEKQHQEQWWKMEIEGARYLAQQQRDLEHQLQVLAHYFISEFCIDNSREQEQRGRSIVLWLRVRTLESDSLVRIPGPHLTKYIVWASYLSLL